MNNIYCMDCKYIYGFRNGGRLREDKSDCRYPENMIITVTAYWDTSCKNTEYRNKPCEQNKNNNCKWFKSGKGAILS